MATETLEEKLTREVAQKTMTQAQADDVREQKKVFESNRATLLRDHQGKVAGYVAGNLQIGDTPHEVIDKAKARFPGRMVYLEGIGFNLLKGI